MSKFKPGANQRTLRPNKVLPRLVAPYGRDTVAIICPVVIAAQGYPAPVILGDRFRVDVLPQAYGVTMFELQILPILARDRDTITVGTTEPGERRRVFYDRQRIAYASPTPGGAFLEWRRDVLYPNNRSPAALKQLAEEVIAANIHGFVQAAMTSTYHGSYRDVQS